MTGAQGTRRLVAGMDVGGTKSHVVAEDVVTGERVVDVMSPNPGWTMLDDTRRAEALVRLADAHLVGAGEVIAVVAGVHGTDSESQQELLRSALATRYQRMDVVNDSELVLPAYGLRSGTGVTAGTGSSATSRTSDGAAFTVGGWGWVLGDEGGAVGIVRDASREVLAAFDRQEDDPLSGMLLDALGISHPHALGFTLSTMETRVWASFAPVVFDAADGGSLRARSVLDHHARALAELVVVVGRRGGDVKAVVAGGGVLTNQRGFFESFASAVRRSLGADTDVALLTHPPVVGGLNLARRLVDRRLADLPGSS